MNACPTCDGPGMLLGQLGHLVHYRCRNCHQEWAEPEDPPLRFLPEDSTVIDPRPQPDQGDDDEC